MEMVEMDEGGTVKLLEISGIKIGWLNFRVRLKFMTACCFRCFGFGHKQDKGKGPNRWGSMHDVSHEGQVN